jgi:hypothetical protein
LKWQQLQPKENKMSIQKNILSNAKISEIIEERRTSREKYIKRKAEINEGASLAYERLLSLAEGDITDQISRVINFLASSFNGHAYPFDLFQLRSLDTEIGDDMILCIDAIRYGDIDLYKLVPDGKYRIQSIIKRHLLQ